MATENKAENIFSGLKVVDLASFIAVRAPPSSCPTSALT